MCSTLLRAVPSSHLLRRTRSWSHRALRGRAMTSVSQQQGASSTSPQCKTDVLCVGGGVAAGYLARAFVSAGHGARLTIVSSDNELPYERPALSKAFLHPTSPARLPGFLCCAGTGGERQDDAWYKAKGVEVVRATRVVGADLSSRTVTLDGGAMMSYDTLVVATGSEASRLPPAIGGDLDGVVTLRREPDAFELIARVRSGMDVVVVGGGYIGMEVSAGLVPHGARVTMVFPEDFVMPRLFTPDLASHYERLLAGRGITVRKNAFVEKIIGDPTTRRATSVALKDGTVLRADLVVVGIGAKPVVDPPFKGLDLAPPSEGGGIKVDARLRASGPGVSPNSVFAVGDVACFPIPVLGEGVRTRVEHVDHARSSATFVADAILKKDGAATSTYDYLPFFYSRIFEEQKSPRKVSWKFYGSYDGQAVVVGDFSPSLLCAWLRGEGENSRLVGVFLESGSDEQNAALPGLARSQPRVPAAALRGAKSAAEAMDVLTKAAAAGGGASPQRQAAL